ncbi:MAG: hypothetical protein ACYSWZ_22135 [Planctomycetota bacterium]|jgi:hypothetical protein
MKSLIRPFVILIVLSLSALSFALKTEDGVFTPGSQRDETVNSINTEVRVFSPDSQSDEIFYSITSGITKDSNYVELWSQHGDLNSPVLNLDSFLTEPSYYRHIASVPQPDSTIPIVVIPAAVETEQTSQLFDAAVKDLNIMCRLFDNQLKLAMPDNTDPFTNITDIYVGISDEGVVSMRPFGFCDQNNRNTNCIYIEGYGALFLMRANIPLTAPPKPVKPKEKPSEPVDKIWHQIKRELYGAPNVQTEKPGKGYDTDAVEEFTTNIVKTLKHAANIKCLKSDDLVIVTANGPQKKAGPPRVLVVRAKKSDIDEFSKGTLDLDSFREKVHIVAPPSSKRAKNPEQATGKPDTAEGAEE